MNVIEQAIEAIIEQRARETHDLVERVIAESIAGGQHGISVIYPLEFEPTQAFVDEHVPLGHLYQFRGRESYDNFLDRQAETGKNQTTN